MDTLAVRYAERLRSLMVKAANDWFQNAVEIGDYLLKMKKELGHGSFLPAIEEAGMSGSQARRYMAIAREAEGLKELAKRALKRVLELPQTLEVYSKVANAYKRGGAEEAEKVITKIVEPKKKPKKEDDTIDIEPVEENETDETVKEKMMKLIAESMEEFEEIAREFGFVKENEIDEIAEGLGYVKEDEFDEVARAHGYVKEDECGDAETIYNKEGIPVTQEDYDQLETIYDEEGKLVTQEDYEILEGANSYNLRMLEAAFKKYPELLNDNDVMGPPLESPTRKVIEEVMGIESRLTKKELDKAIKKAGGQTQLAEELGVGSSTVSWWLGLLRKGEGVSAQATQKVREYIKG